MKNENYSFSQKTLVIIGIILLVSTVSFIFIQAIEVFLLIFVGILLAIFLRGLANQLRKFLPLSMNISLVIVILLIISILAGGGILMGPGMAQGFEDLSKKIPDAIKKLEESLQSLPVGENFTQNIYSTYEEVATDSQTLSKITGIFSTTLGTVVNLFVILIIGLYTAFDPELYKKGIIKLIPKKSRKKAEEVLDAVTHALSWWLVGIFAAMFIVGILTTVGLSILGIPLALTLGILAALLSFVPNIGPVISAIPAILIGLIESPAKALYVIILYVGIQTIESYLITPIIQKKAVSMPPALLISAQILMGIILGVFGLLVATPLMVVIIVIVQILYVKDTLGDSVEILGENQG